MGNNNLKFKIENLRFIAKPAIFLIFSVLVFMSGCGQKRVCPALTNSAEGKKILADYAGSIKPVRATGDCILSYVNEKGEKFGQSFPVRLWYLNSDKFCIYGTVLFDAKGVSFGVDGDFYWVFAKPMDIYVKGIVEKNSEDFLKNPMMLVDFLNSSNFECEKAAFTKNVLVCREKGKTKKIFIDTCNKAISRIEYFEKGSKPMFVVKAEKYEKVKEGDFLFPHKLIYEYYGAKNGKNQLEFKFDSARIWQPQEQQLKALFTPPSEK